MQYPDLLAQQFSSFTLHFKIILLFQMVAPQPLAAPGLKDRTPSKAAPYSLLVWLLSLKKTQYKNLML
jgi:hypothetical protein